jgi:outer membrane protein OmpA-like peptidoglycan-associated protein
VSTARDPLEWLLRPSLPESGIDRKAFAGMLLDVARNVQPELCERVPGMAPVDLRLEQLRGLLLGREIEVLARLRDTVEDPEQLAAAVARILPTAFAEASSEARLGQVMAPALERATQSSIRNDPRTLINILYPMIVPAIRKSITETIDQTFQSINESLKHSLTWRGLRWRWEAWRTGATFAEVVLRHTLVYQVEHVFLIHRHTGLLISHVAAENAASQDPQLVSSMLTAIQDFVRDSFTGAEHQGLDTLRLGQLTLWSEPGPFATLVAVIRGNPPEELHGILANTLSRIHEERHAALEAFDGDSAGLADIEAELTECAALRQQAPQGARPSVPRVIALVALTLLLAIGAWGVRRWQEDRRWEDYVSRLREQPGIVVTEAGRRDGGFQVGGLRDPLAIDPDQLLTEAGIDPTRVIARFVPYRALDPRIALKRLQATLDPPPDVHLTLDGDRIVAQGSAPTQWLEAARVTGRTLSTEALTLDLTGVTDADAADSRRWDDYVARLRREPGLVITEAERRDGRYRLAGLRDPLATDPQSMLAGTGIDPARVTARFAPYQALDPQTVRKRLEASLNPPSSVRFRIDGDAVVAQGSAPSLWLERARIAARALPTGAPRFDLSAVQNITDETIGNVRDAIQSRTVRFDNNEPLPAAGQDPILDKLADELKELASLSAALQVTTKVMVTGHADAAGKGTFNLSLSLARAEVVRALLKKRGVDPDLLAVRGAGALEPTEKEDSDAARSANRRVSFTAQVEERP